MRKQKPNSEFLFDSTEFQNIFMQDTNEMPINLAYSLRLLNPGTDLLTLINKMSTFYVNLRLIFHTKQK